MNTTTTVAGPDPADCPVHLPRSGLVDMVRLMRGLHRLHRLPAYQRLLEPELPAVARFDPGHESVMMGYDFHQTEQGPRLIEVNTNAGGGLLALRAHYPDFSDWPCDPEARHQARILDSFAREFSLFRGVPSKPKQMVIMDQEPDKQFLYPEMKILQSLFRAWGVVAAVADPRELTTTGDGVFFQDRRVDLVYNRHCDFYLETVPLAGLRAAYLAGQFCLTPNPRAYGLLADKRRLALWSDAERLRGLGLDAESVALITRLTPKSRILKDLDRDRLWEERRGWVFKPVALHGSRGVLLGSRITRSRFAALEPESTLVQAFAPPSRTRCPGMEKTMKTDFRLFVYQRRVLGIAARIYQGQVTNFRFPGNGYAPVIVDGGG